MELTKMLKGLKKAIYRKRPEIGEYLRQLASEYSTYRKDIEQVRGITAKTTKEHGETLGEAVRDIREPR